MTALERSNVTVPVGTTKCNCIHSYFRFVLFKQYTNYTPLFKEGAFQVRMTHSIFPIQILGVGRHDVENPKTSFFPKK